MSAQIFPFRFLLRGFREAPEFDVEIDQEGGGRETAQLLQAGSKLHVEGRIHFPNAGGGWTDFVEFWETHRGPFETFLYQRQDPGYGFTLDSPETDSEEQVLFYATRRYIQVSSLIVRVDGVLQVLGDDYTIQNEAGGAYVLGTSTALRVEFEDAPGLGNQVTLEYGFYYPVRFVGNDMLRNQDLKTAGAFGTHLSDRVQAVGLREASSGGSLRDAPNVL